MSRSASYTPRLLAVSRLRGRRGLTGADWARISSVVRSSGSGAGETSAGRLEGRLGGSWGPDFFLLMRAKYPRTGGLTLPTVPARFSCCHGAVQRAGQYNGGVAQLGERVNGIHEVRGSIPLASTQRGGGAVGQ